MFNLANRFDEPTGGEIMTFESYANRLTKHFNQLLNRVTGPRPTGTIDLTPRIPKLSFLQGKQFRQGNGGRKNRAGHSLEHAQANRDNRLEDYRVWLNSPKEVTAEPMANL